VTLLATVVGSVAPAQPLKPLKPLLEHTKRQSFKPFERFKVSITSTFPKIFNSSNDLNDSKTPELEFDEGSLHSTLSDSHHSHDQRLWEPKVSHCSLSIER
jgi:hypothetical protein